MKLVIVLVLSAFLTAVCSQTNSQPNENSKPEADVATNGNGGSQPTESKQPEADSVKKWNGKVGSNHFYWDGKELIIMLRNGKEIKIFSEFAKSDYRFQAKLENTEGCSTSYYYRPLAIAGSLISFTYETGFLCGAVNTASWGYVTFELTSDGRFLSYPRYAETPEPTNEPSDISLSDMFSEGDIFKGLLANERISNDLSRLKAQGKINRNPQDLGELKKLLERFKYDFLKGMFYLDSSALESFAIHHIEGDKVSIWVSLMASSRASQAVQEHLELLLPIPDKLRESLLLADSAKEGFLMKNAFQYVGSSFAQFEFGNKK